MGLKAWEKRVLKAPGAAARVVEIEKELRVAAGLTALREKAGISQREVARRMGVSQPRVAAIERSRNVTIDVLEQYADAIGGKLELAVVRGSHRIPLTARSRSVSATWRHMPKERAAATTGGKPAGAGMRGSGSRSA
jgi:DNA-binding XRE family transcriptional regulator